MFISMASAFNAVLTIGVVLLAIATPQILAQAAGKVHYQQPWTQHAVGPAHQPATISQYYYPAAAKPYSAPAYPYSAPAQPFSVPAKPYSAPVKPYNAPAKPHPVAKQHQGTRRKTNVGPPNPYPTPLRPYRAQAKPFPTPVKSKVVPPKGYSTAAKPYPAAVRPYTTPAKPHQRPVQGSVKKQSYPSAPKKPQRPVAVKTHTFHAGVTQYQYPGGQVQHYTPAKRVQGSKQKQGQVIKKRLTPAQLRQIQQWQIAVQFPPGTQVQPGTGGSPPGPEVPGHIWIQVPVPPQGSYPTQQPIGPPVAQPSPVEPVPEVPVEPEHPEVSEEAEQPQGTFEPEQPQETFEPEQPEPEQPQIPEQPDYPEEPAQTGETFEPEQPQAPLAPEQPDYPEEPAQTGETFEPENPQEPLPVPGNQPIEPLPEEINSGEGTPGNGEEYVPENPDSGAVASGGENGEPTWTEEAWGGDGSQELTEPDPAMALLLESCKEPRGQFPSPSACNKFVNCWDGFAVEQQCPGGLVFSETGFCDFPDNVDCGSRESAKPGVGGGGAGGSEGECPTPYGHYRSLESCGLFYVCVAGNPVKFECPTGLNYNTELGICDYPSQVDCGGTPSDRPPPEEPVTELPENPEVPESTEAPVDPNTSDPAKKFFKLKKRVPAKAAVRPWPVHRAPSRGTPY